MEKGAWQSRPRACAANKTQPVNSLRKPFKKPRQAKETPSVPVKTVDKVDTESEGPTQLQATANSDGTVYVAMSEFLLENPKNSEYLPSPASLRSVSEFSDNEDNVPILATLKPKDNVPKPSPLTPKDNVRPLVDPNSSDSEGDDVPISETLLKVKEICEEVPKGEAAVGVGVARDFGKDLGIFKGKVVHVRKNRHRDIYHILYEDGDEEDFDVEEYEFAYELRLGLEIGKIRPESTLVENEAAWNSDVEVDE